jgi:hypothetical protein
MNSCNLWEGNTMTNKALVRSLALNCSEFVSMLEHFLAVQVRVKVLFVFNIEFSIMFSTEFSVDYM